MFFVHVVSILVRFKQFSMCLRLLIIYVSCLTSVHVVSLSIS